MGKLLKLWAFQTFSGCAKRINMQLLLLAALASFCVEGNGATAKYNPENGKGQVEKWLSLSSAALSQNFSQAKLYADSALKLAQQLKLTDLEFQAYEKLADAEQSAGNYEASFNNYAKAYSYKMKKGLKKDAGHLLNRMGESKRYVDDYKTALDYFQKSIRIYEELKDTNQMGSGYISIGILYALKGDGSSAEKYFLQAISAFKSTGNYEREHLTILNLGGMYKEFGKLEKAVEYSKKAAEYFQKTGNEKRMAVARYNLGVAYFELKRFAESKKEYLICLPIFEKLGDNLRLNGTLMRLSEISLSEGNTDKALSDANRALKGLNSLSARSTKIYLYALISKIYQAKKDYKSALEYRMLYEDLKDSIFTEENNTKIAELEAKYQNKLKKKEIAELQTSNKLKALTIKKKSTQNYVLAGFLLLITMVTLLLINQIRTNKKSNSILQQKNNIIEKALAEKEVLLREIHHRVKNNLQFIWSLFNMQARHVKDPVALATLTEGRNRVKTMALIHQKLYQTESITGIEMREYIPGLVSNIFETYNIGKDDVKLTLDIDRIVLDIDAAMPLGLILNELITNSLKHGLVGREDGMISILLKQMESEGWLLKVSDNGMGSAHFVGGESTETFGLKLIHTLTRQLKAEIVIDAQPGFTAEIKLPHLQNLMNGTES